MFSILHVDNSSFFSNVLRRIFDPDKYAIFHADDVDGAFALLDERPADLIVTAMEFRGGGGEGLIRALNASPHKNIPVIVITSQDTIEIRKRMFTLGVIDYIPKDRDFAERLAGYIMRLTGEDAIFTRIREMRIAVLDDSAMELNIIRNILSLKGISDIDFFNDPAEFLANRQRYDIYFVDLVLPKVSGEQVILEIRKRNRECVIIAVSAVDNYKVISNILLSGADDYILKPFNASIFIARIIASVRAFLLIRELEQRKKELETISRSDPLTGLYNHGAIHEMLAGAVEEARAGKGKLTAMLLGIDNFDLINDSLNHQAGDRIINAVAGAMRECLSNLDALGRYSGVTFLGILPETDLEEGVQLAERIRRKINAMKVKGTAISISGGVVEVAGESAMEVVRKADSLLFTARKKGKNRIEYTFDWEAYS